MTTPPKMPIPQLCEETGISADYENVFFAMSLVYDRAISKSKDGLQKILELRKKFGPCKKYEERYSPAQFKEVITPHNQWRVEALDTLVNWINAYSTGKAEMNDEGFQLIIKIANSLIYGQRYAWINK